MTSAIAEKLIDSREAEPARSRDQGLVRYVGRHGVVTIAHVMKAMGVGRTAAYRRVAACIEAGLLERLEVLRSEPNLLRATPEGLRYAGLPFPVAVISPGAVDHWLRCASTALTVEKRLGSECVLSERELVFAELAEERPIASAEVGALPNGKPRLHRPDLAILTEKGVMAVEVELTPKSPRRLEGLIMAWTYATWVGRVQYLCEPGQTRRAVERAVANVGANRRVGIDEVVAR
ncbi:MAG: hypothetical protein WBM00_03835 [Solirubrobacterales bacterium]